jgi:hypothetical protein
MLPAPQTVIAAIEFGFRSPGMLHDGELVRFANHGFLVHMVDFARVRNAADIRKAVRLLRHGKLRQTGPLVTGSGTLTRCHTAPCSSRSSAIGPDTMCWPA